MSLSSNTIQNLSDVLVSDAIQYIESHENYASYFYQMISDFLDEKMGNMDDTLKTELTFSIMDRMFLMTSIM